MDGKGRATYNAHIERWLRTIEQKYIYLNPAKNDLDLNQGIDRFVSHYNARKHQDAGRKKPMNLYLNTA